MSNKTMRSKCQEVWIELAVPSLSIACYWENCRLSVGDLVEPCDAKCFLAWGISSDNPLTFVFVFQFFFFLFWEKHDESDSMGLF